MEPLLSTKDVTSLFGVDLKKVQRLARTGVLPSLKIGAVYRFRPEALEAWVSSQTLPTGAVQTPRLVRRRRQRVS
jgi:excisionase family DNA binding protein